MARRVDQAALKGAIMRSNTKLLLTSVMLFQASCMLLLAFSKGEINLQALGFAVALPVVTWVVVNLYSKWWQVDRAILTLTLFLCSIGLITLQDIARAPITTQTQAAYAALGLISMAFGIVIMRRMRRWDRWLPWMMAFTALFLVSPLVFGVTKNGAQNWLYIKEIDLSIQPSEFVKPVLIAVLAAGLNGQPRFLKCLPTLIFSAVLCGMLLMQRDLGALLIYFLTTVAIFYAATSNLLVTTVGLGMGVGGAIVAYNMFDYVRTRFEIFQNPWSDPVLFGYQIIQALIAIGSGGLFGLGMGLGYPRNIPLYHSDLIYAAICEEFGLIFALGLIAIYLILVLRGVSVAMSARKSFHALTAFGIVTLLAVQTFIIIGGSIRMIPLTGVTLPFISAGGSSIVSMMGAIGMLLGISSINAHDEVDELERMSWREAGL